MIQALIEEKETQFRTSGYLQFSSSELQKLSEQDVQLLENHFRGHTMMLLPENEISFFEWLKEMDGTVWADLWQDQENAYHVSIDFLHHFLPNKNGFPICDLLSQENFWFSVKHIKPKGREIFERIKNKLNNHIKLTFEEALLYEIALGSIDIWHFCHRYTYPVQVAKQKVRQMHNDDLLVHLAKREDLVDYLDI
jgi:hypothetical protein